MSLLDPPGTRDEATVELEPAEPARLEPASQGLYVSLLGRFGVQVDGVSLSLRGDRRRALLATLLLNTGRVVSTDDLIARVWDTPGQAARGTLQVHIARARALFEQHLGAPLIQGADGGYRIDLDHHRSDLLLFRALAGRADLAAARGETDTHADLLSHALRLWRGPVLADVAAPLLHTQDVPRLNEELLRVAERGFDAALARGEHERVAASIGPIAADHPEREPLIRVQMIALYRAGRQSEALRVYARARSVLAERLGANPGRELQETFHGILRGDLDSRLGLRSRAEGVVWPGAALRSAAPPVALRSTTPEPGTTDPGTTGSGTAVPRQRAHPDTKPCAARRGPEPATGPATCLIPAELPAAPRTLVGRADTLAEIDRLVDPCSPVPGSVLVRGPAGAGSSALAVRWAHSVATHFPDGQLYVNLRGPDGGPLHPADVLGRLVRSLSAGTANPRNPDSADPDRGFTEPDEAAARVRSLMAGRRVLLVLDNAATAHQVRPLLPGTPGSSAVVASRHWLADLLIRDGLRAVPVDALPQAHAVALLRSLLGSGRCPPHALRRIAELAGGLPLALRMAVAWLDAHPEHPAAELVRLVERADPAHGVSPTARMAAVLRAGPLGSGTAAGKYRPGSEPRS
ncbi:AfsR/SARP family transcriptional regulator [Nocardiopsis valliformis]|uniref:AfsR/SARP family transcriptional regulator n=1 Tax=Nocardiopsis valliformis TaxID=239974 RepID=UPI0003467A7F|nr:AfsR/SARP family transcriptional regulator [Nocardiopsis valliformis]